ncbi:hypothetical protein V8C86DRAFT_2651294 [Haematococcus lacustris]
MNITSGVEMEGAFLPGLPMSPSQQDELSCLPPDGVSVDSLLPRRLPTAPMGSPLLFTLAEVAHCASAASSFICVFRCTELQAGETLQQHVQKYNSSTCTTGPFLQTSLQFMSEPMLQCFGFKDLHAAAKWSSRAWRSNSRFMLEWEWNTQSLTLGPPRALPKVLRRDVIVDEVGSGRASAGTSKASKGACNRHFQKGNFQKALPKGPAAQFSSSSSLIKQHQTAHSAAQQTA